MAEEQAKQNTFDIRKIYVKDISVESPNAPGIFLRDPGTPEVSVDASIKASKLEQEGFYEVTLGMTITSKMGEEMAFLVEVQQAGVFHILGLPDADLPLALEIACPNILLPFAREAVSDLVGKAGFPQLLLSPINFEGLYQQKLQQKAASAPETTAEDSPQQ
jgi:preprotein translocase subunit SecB